MMRQLPGYLATLVVALLLGLFIVYPLGAVLVESFVVSGPIPLTELRAMTLEALSRLDPETRDKSVKRWVERAKPKERMEATAAALELIGEAVPWDRKETFSEQIKAAEKTVAALDREKRKRLEDEYPVSIVMLHKRIPLAFKIKSQLSKDEFDRLRSGELEDFGLLHYLSVVKEARLFNALRNSLILSFIACFTATALAFAIAYGINRGGIPMPNLVRYATLIPLVSPPVILATAAVLLFGRNGAFTKRILDDALGLIDAGQTNLYGMGGVVLAQVLSFLPPAFIIMDNVLSKHDGRVEEAAASQGASPWQVFSRITVPLSRPGLVRALILVFILTMTDFGNPLVIGRDIPNLAGVLYDEIIGFQNTELSAALAMWMIVPALSIYFLLEGIGRRKRYDTGEAGGGPPELPVPRPARVFLTALAWAVISITVLLYGSVVVGSFVRIWGIDNTFTLNHYLGIEIAHTGFVSEFKGLGEVWQSLLVAVIAAPVGGLLALVVAYLVERVRPVGGNLLSFVSLLPAILPGVIFGVGYIVAFNFPFGVKELALTGTKSILIINILFANIFVGVLAGRAVLQRLDASVDEAAEILGASLVQRFTRVVLPMMRHAALLGTLYLFVQGMTTLSAVVFLVSAGNELSSVVIFNNAIVTFYGVACAQSVAILVIVFAVMGAMWWFETRGPVWMRLGARAAGRA